MYELNSDEPETRREVRQADPTLYSVFAQQAARAPAHVAVVDADGEHDYRTLLRRAEALALHLCALGTGKGRLVAVLCEKGAHQVVAALSIMGAGAAYLPLDPNWPPGRLEEILVRGSVAIVVLTRAQRARLAHLAARYTLVVVDELRAAPTIATPLPHVRTTDVAYVIFTSGSTGRPKGVVIPHAGALATIRAVNERFHVTSEDRILAVSRLSFDLSVYDLFGMLTAGGTIVFPHEDRAADPAHWHHLIRTHRITLWNSVPQLMQLLVDAVGTDETGLESLGCVLLSGDWIPLALPERVNRLARRATVVSLGGATEGSIWSIWYVVDRVEREWKSIPYGFAMPDQEIHVLDEHSAPCAVGVPGNICIGGKGVALGYWDDPETTARSFEQHPTLGPIFKTGDFGRVHEQGYVEFLGRRDHQIKLNGYRIELEEISAKLALCPGITQAVVLVLTSPGGAAHLAAYYVATDAPNTSELQARLASELPEYMVPRVYHRMDALPLTANGKLDREALLRVVVSDEATPYRAPRTDDEKKVLDVWARVLGADRIGIDDDFFRWGGDSLLAIKLADETSRVLGRSVQPHLILLRPNVAALVDAARQNRERDTIPRIDDDDAPLSFQQESALAEELRAPGISAFPMAFEVVGEGTVPLLKQSLGHVVRKQAALRTRHRRDERGILCQIICEEDFVPDERRISEEALTRIFAGAYHATFDLAVERPIRATFFHTERGTYLLVIAHTIVFDGWSVGVFVDELMTAYTAYAAGYAPPALTQAEIRYVDFARWQRKFLSGEELDERVGFWRDQLAGYEPFTLEAERAVSPARTTAGAYVDLALDAATSESLRQLARTLETTLFTVLLSALYALLYARTKRRDLAVASLVANRTHEEAHHVIGSFFTKRMCRVTVDGEGSVLGLVARVHDVLLRSSGYADAPFDLVMKDVAPDAQRLLLPVMLNVHDFRANLSSEPMQARLKVVPLHRHFDIARNDVELFINPGREIIKGHVIYSTERHTETFAAALRDDYVAILTRLPTQLDATIDELSERA